MNKKIKLMGEINKRGISEVSTDTTIKELIYDHGCGIKGNKKLKLVQIGGPLGVCIRGKEINNSIENYVNEMLINTVMVFNDIFCPVDYLRFITRFLIREIKIDNERVRELNKIIEKIANGKASSRDLNNICEIINEKVDTRGEKLANNVFRYIIDNFYDEILEHVDDHRCANGICRGLIKAQCINACPAGVHIPGYVELMKTDRNVLAYELMRKTNPLSLVCGKVCARPCENRCRRGEIESTVGVRALQRYASEMALNMDYFEEDKLEENGKKVCIVGSGPAGLSAAYFLARTGYDVTIIEALKVIGGMLSCGVPSYRLPYEDLMKEVKTITNLGVKIITDTKVGKDISFDDINNKYDAVILATGSHVGNKIPKFQFEGVSTAVDFLKNVRLNGKKQIGNRVLVVGGGDVAMDAARTSIRLGAKETYVVSLEKYNEMPASSEEKHHANLEGVKFISGYGINTILKSDRLNVELKKCIVVFDDEYRFNPVYDNTEIKSIDVDSVILAIGQRPDISYAEEKISSNRGLIEVDKKSFMTNLEGVFAVGDVIKPSIAIQAIADAKLASEGVDRYLGGNGLYTGREIEIPKSILNITLWDIPMAHERTLDSAERINSFFEVTDTYDIEDAKLEANRCLRCDRNSSRQLLLRPKSN